MGITRQIPRLPFDGAHQRGGSRLGAGKRRRAHRGAGCGGRGVEGTFGGQHPVPWLAALNCLGSSDPTTSHVSSWFPFQPAPESLVMYYSRSPQLGASFEPFLFFGGGNPLLK